VAAEVESLELDLADGQLLRVVTIEARGDVGPRRSKASSVNTGTFCDTKGDSFVGKENLRCFFTRDARRGENGSRGHL
jgi:hypothetical protein